MSEWKSQFHSKRRKFMFLTGKKTEQKYWQSPVLSLRLRRCTCGANVKSQVISFSSYWIHKIFKKPSDLTLTLDVEIWTCLRFLVAALLALFCKSYIASFSRYFTKFVVHPRYCQPAPLCLSLLRSKKQKLVLSHVLSMRELIKKHTVEGAIAA